MSSAVPVLRLLKGRGLCGGPREGGGGGGLVGDRSGVPEFVMSSMLWAMSLRDSSVHVGIGAGVPGAGGSGLSL